MSIPPTLTDWLYYFRTPAITYYPADEIPEGDNDIIHREIEISTEDYLYCIAEKIDIFENIKQAVSLNPGANSKILTSSFSWKIAADRITKDISYTAAKLLKNQLYGNMQGQVVYLELEYDSKSVKPTRKPKRKPTLPTNAKKPAFLLEKDHHIRGYRK